MDERFTGWAAEVGVTTGSVESLVEEDSLVAELDALVAHHYGLSERHVEHVFATFHRGWDYRPRLERVLEHYRAWRHEA